MDVKSAFISYRRKDTEDIAGRLFDRLTGYLGPDSVLLDVDALVSGSNYRTQIERLLERCHVVLLVIGREWVSVQDADGRRRIDDPDDQLRIEVASALESGRNVIPVLVHDASMPAVEELPAEIQGLAALEPHQVQSGASFNTDVQLLIERLVRLGLRPPEATFPWQAVLLPAGIACVVLSLCVGANMQIDQDDDYVLQQLAPGADMSEIRTVHESEEWDGRPFTLARFNRQWRGQLLWVTLPLAVGPVLVVWGARVCCLAKERTATQRHYAQGAGRLPTPKSGKSVLCLALGAASIAAGPLTAVPALAVGWAAWRQVQKQRSWMRGRSLVVAGVIASVVGTALFYYVHDPIWRLSSWIAAMESATAAERAQGAETALAEFDAALTSAPEPLSRAVTLVRRARIYAAQEQHEAAVTDLTEAIASLDALVEQQQYVDNRRHDPIMRAARLQRAEAYERLGRDAAAERDRQQAPGQPSPFFDWLRGGSSDEAPVEAAPTPLEEAIPPAPVVDPDA